MTHYLNSLLNTVIVGDTFNKSVHRIDKINKKKKQLENKS